MGYAKVLVGVLLFITLATTSTAQPPPNFTCSATTKSTCHSLVDYVSPNTTVLSTIQSLFQIMRFHDLLGANGFPTSTSPNETLQAQQRIKIPFNCRCENGTGVSDRAPVYTEIAKVNGITDPNNITIGQELWIPLPCSCDEVEGVKVVHYGHVVESGSSVDKIAMEYGTTPAILLKLNGITNASELQANQVLDVPQRFLPFTSRHSLCLVY
ncbi:lysm domain-containing gpi-anchored protein 2 [Quercus suber]|uniref:Lysm domain-containing gpi-anchored protein 2 n=1 Tax=Quercus suber TaxID=58331 RepID=A0AAW0LQB7_QUESU